MRNTLKVQRALKDISQDDLAKAVGVSRQSIHSIERNKYIPSTLLALKLAQFFNIKVEDIFQLDEQDILTFNKETTGE